MSRIDPVKVSAVHLEFTHGHRLADICTANSLAVSDVIRAITAKGGLTGRDFESLTTQQLADARFLLLEKQIAWHRIAWLYGFDPDSDGARKWYQTTLSEQQSLVTSPDVQALAALAKTPWYTLTVEQRLQLDGYLVPDGNRDQNGPIRRHNGTGMVTLWSFAQPTDILLRIGQIFFLSSPLIDSHRIAVAQCCLDANITGAPRIKRYHHARLRIGAIADVDPASSQHTIDWLLGSPSLIRQLLPNASQTKDGSIVIHNGRETHFIWKQEARLGRDSTLAIADRFFPALGDDAALRIMNVIFEAIRAAAKRNDVAEVKLKRRVNYACTRIESDALRDNVRSCILWLTRGVEPGQSSES